ncbi:MAG: potassium/proton antiporter [Anaerofustis sp.]
MSAMILIAGTVMILCILLYRFSNWIGVPMLLAFILLGMLFGTDGIVKIPFDDFSVAEQICSLALVGIMFYGGFGTKWSEARPIATKAVLLSTVGVLITGLLVAGFCHFLLKMDWLFGLLIGAVVSSTDAASVFSILRSKKLNLKYRTASLLEMESGSNDPFAYLFTLVILSVMNGSANVFSTVGMIVAQILFGVFFGGLAAFLAYRIMVRFRFSEGFDALFVLAVALLAYSAADLTGGNGYLSVYLFGVLLGNKSLNNKKTLVHFFDGITGLMQIVIFFLLGLLSFPSQLPALVLPALAVAIFLTMVARPIAVGLLLTPFRCPLNMQALVAWSGLRGAASVVFTIYAAVHSSFVGEELFHLVLFIVLFSILIQGSLISPIAKKLCMIDGKEDVLKTFNDYSEEIPVQFIQFTLDQRHPWIGRPLSRIVLPPDTVMIQILRQDETIVPNGSTVLQSGDHCVLGAHATEFFGEMHFSELTLGSDHSWVGKQLYQIKPDHGSLIILIQRGNSVIIPSGRTRLRQGDLLVVNRII